MFAQPDTPVVVNRWVSEPRTADLNIRTQEGAPRYET